MAYTNHARMPRAIWKKSGCWNIWRSVLLRAQRVEKVSEVWLKYNVLTDPLFPETSLKIDVEASIVPYGKNKTFQLLIESIGAWAYVPDWQKPMVLSSSGDAVAFQSFESWPVYLCYSLRRYDSRQDNRTLYRQTSPYFCIKCNPSPSNFSWHTLSSHPSSKKISKTTIFTMGFIHLSIALLASSSAFAYPNSYWTTSSTEVADSSVHEHEYKNSIISSETFAAKQKRSDPPPPPSSTSQSASLPSL